MCVCFFLPENKRSIFDQYGEEGLKRGSGGTGRASYSFTQDPREVFSQFFGPGVDPFAMFDHDFGSGSSGTFGFADMGGGARAHSNGFMDFRSTFGSGGSLFGGGGMEKQDPPVEHPLNLSLEDLYTGCTKKMKISRKVLNADGRTSKEDKIVSVDVRPGWKQGTKVTFSKEGDQAPGKIPSDIVFVIQEKPHPKFSREGNNLRHKAAIPLTTALCGGEVDIPHIDGTSEKRVLSNVVGPDTEEVIRGQGMPVSRQPGKRGDLIVNYNIKFPRTIKDMDKQQLRNILGQYH